MYSWLLRLLKSTVSELLVRAHALFLGWPVESSSMTSLRKYVLAAHSLNCLGCRRQIQVPLHIRFVRWRADETLLSHDRTKLRSSLILAAHDIVGSPWRRNHRIASISEQIACYRLVQLERLASHLLRVELWERADAMADCSGCGWQEVPRHCMLHICTWYKSLKLGAAVQLLLWRLELMMVRDRTASDRSLLGLARALCNRLTATRNAGSYALRLLHS